MKKTAVFFPGIGYTADKPLLYYSRKLAAALGYECIVTAYSGLPEKKVGDEDIMQASLAIAFEQAAEMLRGADLSGCEEILFVGKSIGTVIAARIASESLSGKSVRFVLYTPLEHTFDYPLGNAVVFTGDADPWVGSKESRIPAICAEKNIPCTVIGRGNHSLESGDVSYDISILASVLRATESFIKG